MIKDINAPGRGCLNGQHAQNTRLWDNLAKIKAYFLITLILVSFVGVRLHGESNPSTPIEIVGADDTPTITQFTVGDTLGSLNDLNVVAMNQSAVFGYIPAVQPSEITSQTKAALLAAQESLLSLDIVVGLYTLSVYSEDYPHIIQQVMPPAIIVASKGKGMVPVTGDITRDGLIQAFLTADSSTTCGCGQ